MGTTRGARAVGLDRGYLYGSARGESFPVDAVTVALPPTASPSAALSTVLDLRADYLDVAALDLLGDPLGYGPTLDTYILRHVADALGVDTCLVIGTRLHEKRFAWTLWGDGLVPGIEGPQKRFHGALCVWLGNVPGALPVLLLGAAPDANTPRPLFFGTAHDAKTPPDFRAIGPGGSTVAVALRSAGAAARSSGSAADSSSRPVART